MMKMSDKDSKKGQIAGETISLFATTGVLIMILVLFFLAVRTQAGIADTIASDFSKMSSIDLSLKAYLNTPVEILYQNENISIKMSDLIRLVSINSSYRENFQIKTHGIFDRVYGADYSIDIKAKNIPIMIFPPRNSLYSGCETQNLPENLNITICIK